MYSNTTRSLQIEELPRGGFVIRRLSSQEAGIPRGDVAAFGEIEEALDFIRQTWMQSDLNAGFNLG